MRHNTSISRTYVSTLLAVNKQGNLFYANDPPNPPFDS